MEWAPIIKGFTLIAEPMNVGLIFIAVVIGVLVGALPGLTSSMAIALLLPLTIGMEPIPAICMLAALYCAGTFGGSITAILINAPGAPPAVATAFDGYPLAQRGEAGRALGMAAFASVMGGIISLIIFIVAAPALATIATTFRHVEYFALAVFGLSMLATISGRSSLRNLISGSLGVFIGTVGMHMGTGIKRFIPFDMYMLEEGIGFVPVLIGLFAFGELLNQSGQLQKKMELVKDIAIRLPSIADFKKVKGTIGRSSIIGTVIGILPAEGATVAAIIGLQRGQALVEEPGRVR